MTSPPASNQPPHSPAPSAPAPTSAPPSIPPAPRAAASSSAASLPPAASAALIVARIAAFGAAVVACLLGYLGPELALLTGIVLALANLSPAGDWSKKLSRLLIQVCVVLLGFRMNLHDLQHAGLTGTAFAAASILGTFALAAVLGLWLRTDAKITTLLASGTAICGGSAIAAVGSVVRASSTQMSVAIGTVFILNGLALYIFPPLGHALGLTPSQFGTWAGIAIHDVASVFGAARTFDQRYAPPALPGSPTALDIATAVKLARVLWIVPVCIVVAWGYRRLHPKAAVSSRTPIPWFIGLFVLASVARSYIPSVAAHEATILRVASLGMTLALLLIGAALSRKALASVGWRPMLLGVILWIFISLLALAAVRLSIA